MSCGRKIKRNSNEGRISKNGRGWGGAKMKRRETDFEIFKYNDTYFKKLTSKRRSGINLKMKKIMKKVMKWGQLKGPRLLEYNNMERQGFDRKRE